MEIFYKCGGCALGDSIFVLSLFNNPKFLNKNVAFEQGWEEYNLDNVPYVFNNKANIVFLKRPVTNTFNDLKNNWSTSEHKCIQLARLFNSYGEHSLIPEVYKEEDAKTEEKINKLLDFVENPIVFHPHNRSYNLPGSCSVRDFNEEKIRKSIEYLNSIGFTPIGFPIKKMSFDYQYPEIEGIYKIHGLTVKELCFAYRKIGKYFGSQSGAADLMVATGGRSVILVPDSTPQFPVACYNWDQIFELENIPSLTKTLNFRDFQEGLEYVEYWL